jgi:hypothetical protein
MSIQPKDLVYFGCGACFDIQDQFRAAVLSMLCPDVTLRYSGRVLQRHITTRSTAALLVQCLLRINPGAIDGTQGILRRWLQAIHFI